MRIRPIYIIISIILVVGIILTVRNCSCAEELAVEEESEPETTVTLDDTFRQRYADTVKMYEDLIEQYNGKLTELTQRQVEYLEARQWYETQCQAIKERNDDLNKKYNSVIIELASVEQSIHSYQQADLANIENTKLMQERYDKLVAKLEEIKSRENYTVSTNLTIEKRAAFYEMLDLVYPELWE